MNFRERYQYNPKTDLVGKGGFARVYKAYDTFADRPVALKKYIGDVSGKYDLIADMKRGIKLEHPNLCRYYDVAILKKESDFGEEEEEQIGILEYLDGGNIKEYTKKNPASLKKLLIDVLHGLSYLHNSGMVHRDIKPQNILIKTTPTGPVAKITDFGISKQVNSEFTTKSTSLLGSIQYMAPEQLVPEKYGQNGRISYNLDLWSFGCLTYELVTGESIYGKEIKQLTTEQIFLKLMDEVDGKKIDVLDEPYRTVVKKCLLKNANSRVKKSEELINLLANGVLDEEKTRIISIPQTAYQKIDSSSDKRNDGKKETTFTHMPGNDKTNIKKSGSTWKPINPLGFAIGVPVIAIVLILVIIGTQASSSAKSEDSYSADSTTTTSVGDSTNPELQTNVIDSLGKMPVDTN